MRKIGNRIAVLLGIFFLSLTVFFVLAGEEGTVSETQEMSEATFPVLFFTCGGESVNETFGYAQQMDASSIRDTITPVEDDLTIPVTIDAYDNDIISISYNVYASDGAQLLEQHSAVAIEVTDGEAQASVILYDEIDSGTEEVLEIILKMNDGQMLYYYTRLTMQEEVPVTLGMSFVKTFHEETLSGSDGSSLSAYMETDSGTAYTSLDHVTIESSLELVMWGTLAPVIASEISLDISEINESYQAYTMTYLVSSALTGATYYVEEYFRIRIISSQVYLLDYDRTAEQIFTALDSVVSGDELKLGIRDADVDYVSSDDGSIVAFIQAGELWEYNAGSGSLIRVFGYLDTDANGTADTDFRDLNMDHGLKICSMDESGNLYFLVTGYCNRGEHEGENGVSLYYYDAINGNVEEKVFFVSDTAYQVLKEEIGMLAYVNSSGDLCLSCGGTLYEISMDTLEIEILVSGIDPDYCVVSESGRYAAFLYEGESDSASYLFVVDLNTGSVTEVSGGGSYVRPIGYLEENLIYGAANAEDLTTDAAGNVVFAMNTLVILGTDLSVLKEYDEGNYYVTEAVIENGVVRLTRVTKSSDGYEEASDDTIIDYDHLDSQSAVIGSGTAEGTEETQVLLEMSVSVSDEISLIIPQATVTDSHEETSLLQAVGSRSWRMYRKQKLVYAGDSLSEAIAQADETAGVVTDASGNLIWRRNNTGSASVSDIDAWTSASGSEAACAAAALAADGVSSADISAALETASTAEEIVSSVFPDAVFLNLIGCTLDEVLYFTAQGRCVLTSFGGSTYIISSYTSSTVTVYNPLIGGSSTYSMSDLDSILESAGNVFCTWLLQP